MTLLKLAALSLLLLPADAATPKAARAGKTPLADEKAFAEGALDLLKRKEAVQRLLEDMRPRLKSLSAATKGYAGAPDLETLSGLREGSAAPVRARMKELKPLWDAYLRGNMSLASMGEALSMFVVMGQRPASDVAQGVDVLRDFARFRFDTTRALREAQELLDQEEAAYAAARTRIQLSRQRRIFFFGLATAAAAVLALAILLRRRGSSLRLEWKTKGS